MAAPPMLAGAAGNDDQHAGRQILEDRLGQRRQDHGIEHRLTKVNHPWINGQAGAQSLDISEHIDNTRYMDSGGTILALGALAQSTRMDTFRLLIRHEPQGLPAGEIARQLAVPQNTMSSHLAVLARAGLVRAERQSRSIVYRADLDGLREMMLFLVKDCCGGRAELCEPLVASIVPCCSAGPTVLQ